MQSRVYIPAFLCLLFRPVWLYGADIKNGSSWLPLLFGDCTGLTVFEVGVTGLAVFGSGNEGRFYCALITGLCC